MSIICLHFQTVGARAARFTLLWQDRFVTCYIVTILLIMFNKFLYRWTIFYVLQIR